MGVVRATHTGIQLQDDLFHISYHHTTSIIGTKMHHTDTQVLEKHPTTVILRCQHDSAGAAVIPYSSQCRERRGDGTKQAGRQAVGSVVIQR